MAAALELVSFAASLQHLPSEDFQTALHAYIKENLDVRVRENLSQPPDDKKHQAAVSPINTDTAMVEYADLDDAESREFEAGRRASLSLGDPASADLMESMKTGALHKLSLLDRLTDAQVLGLARSFIDCVKISGNTVNDVAVWFDKKVSSASTQQSTL